MRRCKYYFECREEHTIGGYPDLLFCYVFECLDYSPIDIDNDWKIFMDNLNRSLGDWKSYFS